MIYRLALLAFIAVQFCLPAPIAIAQDSTNRVLIVGTKSAPPFVIKSADGKWEGISIELWQAIAAELGLSYKYQESSLEELIAGVAAGRINLAVAALTVTPERETQVDFSHPFYSTGLAIAVPARQGGGWFAVAKRFISLEFLSVIGALVLILFGAGFLVWFFERRRNPDQFGGSITQGLSSGFWWSAVTMTTVGYGDKAPVTMGGRLVGLAWMFAAIIIISGFTASITSSLTVNRLEGTVKGLDDLGRVRTSTVASSTSGAFLAAQNIPFRNVASVEDGLKALMRREQDALVYDAPVLKFLAREHHAGELMILSETFNRQDYAIAVPEGSPLREQINRVLLQRLGTAEWRSLLKRYLGN